MTFPKLKKFATIKGWEIVKNSAYGEENGYLFTLIDGPGFKTLALPLPQISEEEEDIISEYMENNKKKLKISSYEFEDNVLLTTFKESFASVKLQVMNNYLQQITGYLGSLNIKGRGYCVFCKKSGADQTIYVDGIIYSAHDDCYYKEIQSIDEVSLALDTEEKNYLSGFIGAILGGIICSIPWIVVQSFLQRIAAVLAFIIGIGALKGYYLLKGRLGPFTRWIVAFATIVSVAFAVYASLAIEMVMNDIPLSMQNYILVLDIPEVADTVRGNLIMSMVMAALGIIGLFKNLKGDSKDIVPSMSKR